MRARLEFSMILPLVLAGFVQCASGQGAPCIRAYGAGSVEQFLRGLQHSVAVDDRAHVVEMVGFPIKNHCGSQVADTAKQKINCLSTTTSLSTRR